MKEPKILPDGTDIHNIRRLSSRVLDQFIYWHQEDDELKMVAKDEMALRFLIAKDYMKNHVQYTVEELKPGVYNTEFSDSYGLNDEVFW